MTTSLIMAVSENGVIGIGNKLPFRLSYDLKWFKMNTFDSIVIMGRKTWQSIPKKPLKNRISIVLSRSADWSPQENTIFCTSLAQALDISKNKRRFIIGGSEIYRQALLANIVDSMIITRVHTIVNHRSAIYADEPENKIKIWSSKNFFLNKLSFHFEIYNINKKL